MMLQYGEANPVEIAASTVVGRGVVDGFNLAHGSVSGLHAMIGWHRTRRAWLLFDLGSSNGTRVSANADLGREYARKLPVGGGEALMPGMVVYFGDEAVQVLDVSPPPARAQCLQTGEVRLASDDVLPLPDETDPEVMVVPGVAGWVIRDLHASGDDEVTTPLMPQDEMAEVTAGGRRWSVWLPTAHRTTRQQGEAQKPAYHFVIELRNGGDDVQFVLQHGDERITLPTSRHHEIVWLLARAQDRDQELAEADRGWVAGEEILARLGLPNSSVTYVGVLVHRLRRQVTKRLESVNLPPCPPLIVRKNGRLRLAVRVVVHAVS